VVFILSFIRSFFLMQDFLQSCGLMFMKFGMEQVSYVLGRSSKLGVLHSFCFCSYEPNQNWWRYLSNICNRFI